MSILDIKKKRHVKRTALVTFLISLFLAVFAAVYEHFGHGVISFSMISAFSYLLLGGTLVSLFFLFVPFRHVPGMLPRELWYCGLATLTVGNIVKGVLEIYGTTNRLTSVYTPAGIALLAAGALIYVLGLIFLKRSRRGLSKKD